MARAKIWLKNFDVSNDFVVAKNNMTIGEKVLNLGDPFDKSLVSVRRLRQLYDSRRITAVAKTENAVEVENDLTKTENCDIIKDEPKAVLGQTGDRAKWYHVEIDGEKVGKSTRNKKEAQGWVDELNG